VNEVKQEGTVLVCRCCCLRSTRTS